MKQIGIGILGFGTIGAGVAEGLLKNRALIAERTGADVVLRKIAEIDETKIQGSQVSREIFTGDAAEVYNNPDIDVVVELIGGTGIAKKLVCDALKAGKSVVTANKKLLAEYGAEIFTLAAKHGADIYFGAAVGGAIPIIRSLRDGLAGNRIESIHAILNGTCNFILTAMEKDGISFDEALVNAQNLGFAEKENPSLDVDGFDTQHKAAILATIAYGSAPALNDLPVEGIRGHVEADDIKYASDLGYRIKLLAIIKQSDENGEVEIRVAPTLVPKDSMLGSVSGVFNAAMVKGDLSDKTLYYGRGAGRYPTASTVIGDISDIARRIASGATARVAVPQAANPVRIKKWGEITSRFYLRLALADKPGALAATAGVFGKHSVSIAAAMQKDLPEHTPGHATIVMLTHPAKQADIDAALAEIEKLDCCGGKPRRMGIEE
ncbi:MAG: homoserine dehydrogenase [Kiritimatiellaeota bacterium]|nr:homoserine dehydrogenase [Kiritimatiellota bacterium]